MKTIVLLGLGFLALAFVNADSFEKKELPVDGENYKVIKVDGVIVYKKSGKNMATGDVFGVKEPLNFKTNNSRAAVISKAKGRKILAANSTSGKSSLLPAMNNISSRHGAILNKIDLQNHFKGNYVVVGKNEIKISGKSYPMEGKNFFFLSYNYKGEKINKKLSFSGDTLLLDREEILSVDEKAISASDIEGEVSLNYMKEGGFENISNFTLIFPDENTLEMELKVISETVEEEKEDVQLNEMMAYINEFYGQPEKQSFKKWLEGKGIL